LLEHPQSFAGLVRAIEEHADVVERTPEFRVESGVIGMLPDEFLPDSERLLVVSQGGSVILGIGRFHSEHVVSVGQRAARGDRAGIILQKQLTKLDRIFIAVSHQIRLSQNRQSFCRGVLLFAQRFDHPDRFLVSNPSRGAVSQLVVNATKPVVGRS
jgi:hypothetical protein